MMRKRREPTWSVLIALVCLLGLSALASRAWDRVAGGHVGLASTPNGGNRGQQDRGHIPAPPDLEAAPMPPPLHGDPAPEPPATVVVSDNDSPSLLEAAASPAVSREVRMPELPGYRTVEGNAPEPQSSLAHARSSDAEASDAPARVLTPPADLQPGLEMPLPQEPSPLRKPSLPIPRLEPERPRLPKPDLELSRSASSEPVEPKPETPEPTPSGPVVSEEEASTPETSASMTPQAEEPGPATPAPGPLQVETPKPASQTPVAAPETDQTAENRRDEPDALMDCLEDLVWECETGEWAMEVRRVARRAMNGVEQGSDEASATLGQLSALAQQSIALAGSLSDELLASKVRRAEYALRRRLDVWKQALHAGGPTAPAGKHAAADPDRLAACLDKVEAVTGSTAEGRAWQKYLALDVFRGMVRRQGQLNEDQSRALARQILLRLNRVRMTDEQRGFIASRPMAEFSEELRRWAIGSVDGREVLKHIERYERSGLPSDARVLAEDYQRLGFSPTAEHQELGRRLESHYRNANVRFVVSSDLLNRLAPSREPEYYAVNDTILGRSVQGQSVNASKVHVRLVPDPQRLRLALEVNGQVASLTTSNAGPATFYDNSQAYYTAWKEMELGTFGVRIQPAQVRVQNDIYLRDVDTNLDAIPLLGALAQNVARKQHEQSKYAAAQEAARKIEYRAKQQIDAEVDARLAKFSERLQERVIRPMDELALDPTMISAQTGERRMAARVRLASPGQLGGHTPRPQAPADSVASLQLHESAMNNIVEQLGLNGATMTVKQLRERLASRFPKAALFESDPENDQAEITFATRDAVRVRCDEGRLSLAMAMVALRRGPHEWNDFQVRIFYRPVINERSIHLARDGVIHLMGERLNTRTQIAVRGVFGKTFSKQRTWDLTPEGLATDPRLADMAITQCTIHDGWVGLALGPKRPPAAVARRPVDARQ